MITVTDIASLADARQALNEVAEIANPIQRGDQPYSFDVEQLKEAMFAATEVLMFAEELLAPYRDAAINFKGSRELLEAGSYMRSIAHELEQHPEADEALRSQLGFYKRAPRYLSERIINVDAI